MLDATPPLAGEDRECAAILLDALEREGIRLRSGVEIAKVSRSFGKVHVVLATPAGSETIQGSHLLIAVGRRPNMHDLNLEAAGIRYGDQGIVVDAQPAHQQQAHLCDRRSNRRAQIRHMQAPTMPPW